MRLLLDTQILLWQIADDPRLTGKLRDALIDTANDIVVSDVTLWEVVIKNNMGRLSIPPDHIDESIKRDRYSRLGISRLHIRRVGLLEQHHRDPFDRLLIAQALTEDMPILTADRKFASYGVRMAVT